MKIALIGLQQTTFTNKCKEIKQQIERDVKNLIEQKKYFPEENMEQIEMCYEEWRQEYDIFIDEIKEVFIDSKKQKDILNRPDTFIKEYQESLDELYQDYKNTCLIKIDDIYDVSKGFLEILGLANIVGELFKNFKKSRKDFKNMSEMYFEENYASQLRLKAWKDY